MQLPSLPLHELRILHIGGYWRGQGDIVRQMMLGLGDAGADVCEYSTDDHPHALDTDGRGYDRGASGPVWLRWDVLNPIVQRVDPHVIVCNAGGLSFRPEVAAELRERRSLVGIALSDPDVFEPTTRHIAANFDAFLTCAPAMLARYRALGVRVALLPAATHAGTFHPVEPRVELRCEVLVMGAAHADRIEPVRQLVEHFDTHVYGEGWQAHGIASRGLVEGDDVLAALSSAKITVVFFRTPSGHPLVKAGLFGFPAAGALVATNHFSEVAQYFKYGEEVIGFHDTPDLLRQIRYYLDHPGDAERIRLAGRQRVLREHTWRAVWPRVFASLRPGAARRDDPRGSALTTETAEDSSS